MIGWLVFQFLRLFLQKRDRHVTIEIIHTNPGTSLKWINPPVITDLTERELACVHFLKLVLK